MVCISDLQQLLSRWQERMDSPLQPLPYKDAVSECVYELNNLINRSIEEELEYQDMLDTMRIDDYLSTIDAHEKAA